MKAAAEKDAAEKAAATREKWAADKAAAAEKTAAEHLAKARRAGEVAANSWKSLAELVECANVVHEGRGDDSNSAASVLELVADFAALRKELEGGAVHTAASATVGEACRAAEEQFRASRMAAEVSQREVSPYSRVPRSSGCPTVVC